MNHVNEPLNPYASPASSATPEEPLSHEVALRSLRRPAVGVLTCAACGIVILMVTIVWVFIRDLGFRTHELTEDDVGRLIGGSIGCTLLVAVHSISSLAAVKTMRGRTAFWPWVAVIAGVVPFGPCGLLSAPFALWLAILLVQSRYRTALARSQRG
jgi:hypothetical protein